MPKFSFRMKVSWSCIITAILEVQIFIYSITENSQLLLRFGFLALKGKREVSYPGYVWFNSEWRCMADILSKWSLKLKKNLVELMSYSKFPQWKLVINSLQLFLSTIVTLMRTKLWKQEAKFLMFVPPQVFTDDVEQTKAIATHASSNDKDVCDKHSWVLENWEGRK